MISDNEFNEYIETFKAKLQAKPELRQDPRFIAFKAEILEDWKRSVDNRFQEMRAVLDEGITALNVVLSSTGQLQKKVGEQDYEAKQTIADAAVPLKKFLTGLMNKLRYMGVAS
jgi:hypothetical protein